MQMLKRIGFTRLLLLLALSVLSIPKVWAAAACAAPGSDGSGSVGGGTPSGVVYMTPTANAAAAATRINVSSTTGLAAGDLVLVIQMQGADINTNNTTSYGSGVAGGNGSGYLSNANLTAGTYEYAAVASVTATRINLSSALINSYVQANYGTNGQRRYQVVRVPQYQNLTLTGDIYGKAWDGTATGGVLPLDVAGILSFNGYTITMDARGFRGGAASALAGDTGGANTDYRTSSTKAYNGSKAEGIAGTPIYTYNQIAGTVTTGANEGYVNGSFARGAPGNAGGGGTDGNQAANDQNSGGGGGGNGGAGAQGGNSWSSNQPVGGKGGAAFADVAVNRIVMGGGGGAGSRNNSAGYQSSGGQGGGIVLVRAATLSGTGTISANGGTGVAADNDGSGGGGAGGSIVVLANIQSGSLTLNAQGGAGGNNCSGCTPPASNLHGPGGGGGGGVVYTNSAVSASVNTAQGASGATADGTVYGATPSGGVTGGSVPNSSPTSVDGSGLFSCLPPVLNVVKTVSAVSAVPGTTLTYTITITNTGGPATAVTLTDIMPPLAFTVFVPNGMGGSNNFLFTDNPGSPSGFTAVGTTTYSTNNGSTYPNTLPGATGWQNAMTNWKMVMPGTMSAGGSFTIQYKVMIQ
jgi:uncharacterized repeat protein (TIGR01451 family)